MLHKRISLGHRSPSVENEGMKLSRRYSATAACASWSSLQSHSGESGQTGCNTTEWIPMHGMCTCRWTRSAELGIARSLQSSRTKTGWWVGGEVETRAGERVLDLRPDGMACLL